ncbi:MAG TPA: transporter [Usitatibacter sp.]|nr:transporter [Usitatibacter sp.]
MQRKAFAAAAAVAMACAHDAAASCGAAFCLVNTDWSAQGAWVEPGVRFDLRFETVTLDQPRTGTARIGVGQIPRHHDEVETKNRNWVANIDWSPAAAWGLSLSIPYVDREHMHIHNHRGAKLFETWTFRELGDVRVQARHELFASRDAPERQSSVGVMFGVKLPTGKHDVANSEGPLAERTLQPGTGTTDVLLGVYWHGMAPLSDVSWFARAQGVFAANSRDGFKPGRQVSADLGARYAIGRDIGLMLQMNYVDKGRDSGAEAEPADSGQRQLFVSPGVSWNLGRSAQLYAFVQVPLYQRVHGVQLTADWSALAGASWRF